MIMSLIFVKKCAFLWDNTSGNYSSSGVYLSAFDRKNFSFIKGQGDWELIGPSAEFPHQRCHDLAVASLIHRGKKKNKNKQTLQIRRQNVNDSEVAELEKGPGKIIGIIAA